MMQKNSDSAGFTLLEVLIAMTLLSIMVILLFSSLKVGAESWNKGETKISEVNEKAVVYQFFKRHLPSARPLWNTFTKDHPQFSFQGQEHKIAFVSTFPASAVRHGLQLFEVGLDKGEHSIKVKLKPFYPEIDGQEWQAEEVTLLEQVESFEIAYFDADVSGSGGRWESAWEEREFLPALIKIKITLQEPSYWPDMIFPVKLGKHTPENGQEG